MSTPDVSVIRLSEADVEDPSTVRDLLADALTAPESRVLADLSALSQLGGSVIAEMMIASKGVAPGGRFAVYAPEPIFRQLNDWRLVDSWPCFGEWEEATRYLCAEDA